MYALQQRSSYRGSNRFYQNGLTYLGAVDGLPLGRKAPMPEKLVSALSNLEDVLVVGVVESWPTTIDSVAGHARSHGPGALHVGPLP